LLQELHHDRTFYSQYRPGDKYVPPISISDSSQAPIDLIDNSPIAS